MNYRHLFFDMDQTIAPSRQLILPEMHSLLKEADQTIVIVSGQEVEKIQWQSNSLPAFVLGQNGNHAVDEANELLWKLELEAHEQEEILSHIEKLLALLPEAPNPAFSPVENRGAQITFSPIGNTAPVELKKVYDPDRSKREALLRSVPFDSENLIVKIGGSTSLDYIHKERHKGANVAKLIEKMGWDKTECVYFGDGLYPGGNDEAVIGVIDTIAVADHVDCYNKLKQML